MNTTTKIILGTSIVVALLGGSALYSAYNLGRQVQTTQKIRLHHIDADELVLAVKTTITNPSNSSIMLQNPPYVAIYKMNDKGERSLLGLSEPSSEYIEVEAQAKTELQDIYISIPTLKLIRLGAEIIQTKSLKIEADIKIGIRKYGIPVSFTQTIKEDISLVGIDLGFNSIKDLILGK